MALEVSFLPALHIHGISESLPFALTATLILPHNLALKNVLSSVTPLPNASFHHSPTFQGQFNQLGDGKEISYHFAQIAAPSIFHLPRQAFVTHSISDMLQNQPYCNTRKNISYLVMTDEGSEKKELYLNFETNTYLKSHQN